MEQRPVSPYEASAYNPAQTSRPQSGAAQETGEKLKGKGNELKARTKQQSSAVADRAKSYGSEVFCNQRDRAAEEVSHFSGAMREAGRKLHEEKDETIACYLDSAAGQVDRLNSYIKNCEPRQLLDDIDDVAHKNPVLFAGGLFAAGIAIGRMLKASGSKRDFGYEEFDETYYGYERGQSGGEGIETSAYNPPEQLPPASTRQPDTLGGNYT